ncbi:MAG: hypothetical protein IPP77_07765 [Bacteroidetes bacterium]|nr:hypothetical protein [Bacteroidota bacterium]
MKTKKYDYYHAIIRKAEQLLELRSLEEFVHYANANHLKQIIVTRIPETDAEAFGLASKGALYVCPTAGYESLEDFQTATENSFPDSTTFYAAQQINCSTYAEYQTAQEHSITDASVFEEMKTKGYVDGYVVFERTRNDNPALPRLGEITHVKDLFDYAQEKSFTDFRHFMTVWEAGFTNPLEHQMAIEKGLNNSDDFKLFNKGCFISLEEFKLAKSKGILSKKELEKFVDLSLSIYPDAAFDELLLISIVSKLPNGQTTEFKKLYDFFVKSTEDYKRTEEDGQVKFPQWFTRQLSTEEEVKKFLVSSNQVKLFGTYDADKNLFETKHIELRMVVVDGSNVAYNSNMADRKKDGFKAELKNILIVVKKLRTDYHFEDIHVISDSNLYHVVKDRELLKEIKELCKYSESPSGIPADVHLIKQVKKHHCLLVTNDNFTDWKIKDKWLEDNIGFYRLPFMLNGDVVLIPYMDKYKK